MAGAARRWESQRIGFGAREARQRYVLFPSRGQQRNVRGVFPNLAVSQRICVRKLSWKKPTLG
jgi:hypothetical protein